VLRLTDQSPANVNKAIADLASLTDAGAVSSGGEK
jgi:hypothetical protein